MAHQEREGSERAGDGEDGATVTHAILKQMPLLDQLPTWLGTRDGDEAAAALYRRHYSCYQYADGRRNQVGYRNRFLIVGPGERMVLLTPQKDALFVWRRFIDKSGQEGVNCAVFRNESGQLASTLILAAEQIAWSRWPRERLYTYVDASAVRSSNPGYCYLMAGWRKCGFTQSRGLLILEKFP